MPAIGHFDELLGTAWAWDDDDEQDGPSAEDEAPPGLEDLLGLTS